MKKRFLQRTMSLMLVLSVVLSTMTVPAFAATRISGLSVPNLTAEYTLEKDLGYFGSGSWWASDGDALSGKATGEKGALGTKRSASVTLTLKNTSGKTGVLSFNYNYSLNGGNYEIKPKSDTATENAYNKTLNSGESVTIKLTSPEGRSSAEFTLSQLKLIFESKVTARFLKSNGGSYTVDDISITDDGSITKNSTTAFSVSATADSTHKFFGWYNETAGKYESYLAQAELMFKNDVTVYPVFVDKATCIFQVQDLCFTDLNDADSYASSHGNKIVLVSDGTLPAGNYTISSGNTLLIPFDSAGTVVTNSNLADNVVAYEDAHNVHTLFRELTLSSGTNIQVNGSVSVASKVYAQGTGQDGPYGQITMNEGSSMTLNSGSNLYVFGYIRGSGTIDVTSGANVYESMCVLDYPGSASSTNNLVNAKAFPFSKFTVQNVEVPMTLRSGAAEKVFYNFYGSSSLVGYRNTWVEFFGTASTSFLKTSDYLIKSYRNNRQCFEMNGTCSLNDITIQVGNLISSITVDTTNLSGVTIPYNFDILVNSGTTTLNANTILSKGSTVTVNSGATINIASDKKFYVMDSTEDPQNVGNQNDAKLDINGTVTVNGGLLTSASGANIISSGKTGTIQYSANAASQTDITIKTGSGANYKTISCTPAQLHNGDGSYTATKDAVRGDVYHYCSNCHKWYKVGNHHLVNLYVNDSETAFVRCTNDISVSFENIENPALNETTYEPAETEAKASYDSDTKTLTVNGLDAETTTVHVYTARAEVVTVNNEGTSSSTAYSTIQKAINDCTEGSYIRMITDSTEARLELTGKVYLDLAGKTVTLKEALSGSGKLYGMDSTATNYQTVPTGKLILPGGTVAQTAVMPGSGETYVKIVDGNTYSFHRCNLYINGYRFELNRGKNEGALIFQATLQGDGRVMAAAQKGGFVINDTAVDTDKDEKPVALTGGQFEGYWHTTSVKDKLDTSIRAVARVYFSRTDKNDPAKTPEVYLTFKEAMKNASGLTSDDKEKINAFFGKTIFETSSAT